MVVAPLFRSWMAGGENSSRSCSNDPMSNASISSNAFVSSSDDVDDHMKSSGVGGGIEMSSGGSQVAVSDGSGAIVSVMGGGFSLSPRSPCLQAKVVHGTATASLRRAWL